MNADEAFDNLLNRNELNIPVVAPAGDADVTPPAKPTRPVPPSEDEVMRVTDVEDALRGDYQPRGGAGGSADSVRRAVFSHPTETDLDAVEDDVASAELAGARIMGRDTRIDEDDLLDDTRADGDDEESFRDAEVLDEDEYVDPRLGRVRWVRRFAYIPLAGMESFEGKARDVASRITALTPERPSLVVTSPARGEGRTELAIRLALALAKRVDYRILLADFDLRKPGVGARLGISSKYFTIGDVLRGSCPLGEALVASREDNLYVLPARASDRDGDEILDSRQVETLFAEMHEAFDFIVIDCGPANHADAVILCRLAGAAALAGYCGVSSTARLITAAERLETSGARLAGLLVAGA